MKKNFHALGKRALALLVCLTMCVSLLQVTAFAAPGEEVVTEDSNVVEEATPSAPKTESETKEPVENVTTEPSEDKTEEPSEDETKEPSEDETKKPSETETKEPAEDVSTVEEDQLEDKTPDVPSSQPTDTDKSGDVSQKQPEADTKPATPSVPVLTTPTGALTYIVNKFTTTSTPNVGDKCPKCEKGIVVEEKGNPNHLICTYCTDFSYYTIQESKPEPEKCNHDYVDGWCTICKEADPNHVHEFNESGKCVCGEQHVHSWQYKADIWHEFTHVKYCSGCDASETEFCPTEEFNYWGIPSVRCSLGCGWQMNAEDVHHWSDKWEPDGKGSHTQTCTDADCSNTRTEECKLVASDDATSVECSVCGWVKYNDGTSGDINKYCPDGKHEFGAYQHNEGYHWQQCMNCSYTTKHEQCNFELEYKGDSNVVIAQVCSVCGNTKALNYEVPVCTNTVNGHDWRVNRTELATDGKTQLVIVKCANCGAEKVDGKCDAETSGLYKLTVLCVDEQGKVLKTIDGGCYAKEAYYKVECPEIPGYTADETVKTGEMPAEDTVIRVIYRAGYTLTIEYVYDDTDEVFDTYTTPLKNGDAYNVPSPDLTNKGYDLAAPQDAVKSGKIDGENVYYRVDYKPINYTWTINYVDQNGNPVKKQDVEYYTVNTVGNLPDLNMGDIGDYKFVSVKGDKKPTAETLGNAETTLVYEPATKALTLTIKYHYGSTSVLRGQEVAQDYTNNTLKEGDKYSVPSASAPAGYKAEMDVVNGVMPAWDELHTVKYDPITYTWTIKYVDQDGNQLFDPEVATFNVEKTLEGVQSPVKEGYTTNLGYVARPTDDLTNHEVVVTYTRSFDYGLTIVHRYLDGDGNLVEEQTVDGGKYRVGDTYDTKSMDREGYTLSATPDNASGTFDTQDLTVIYVYTANPTTPGPDVPTTPGPEEPTTPAPEEPTTPTPPSGGGSSTPTPTPPVNPNPPAEPDDPVEIPDDPDVPLVPGPGVDIEDPDVPLVPGPGVDIEDPDVPLAPGPDVDITDPDVPTVNKPTAPAGKNPVPQPTATGLTEIVDEDVPLAEVPQTGDNSGLWLAAAILAACGLVAMNHKKREEA